MHAFTATGVVLAFLAMLAVERRAFAEAFLWLGAALIVDGVDGSLARWARVREHLPRIDGAALDLVIDYISYVFVPALLILRGGYLPPDLQVPFCSAILVSSLYVFARRDMKTDDGYFRGFPALWNVIALYLFILEPSQAVAAIIIAALVAMTFAPVRVVHPFRVSDFGAFPAVLVTLWALTTTILLLPLGEVARTAALAVSAGSALALIALGLLRTARGPCPKPQ